MYTKHFKKSAKYAIKISRAPFDRKAAILLFNLFFSHTYALSEYLLNQMEIGVKFMSGTPKILTSRPIFKIGQKRLKC